MPGLERPSIVNKSPKTTSFNEQMAHSMAELRDLMTAGTSPTADGRLTVRTIEVSDPSTYDAKRVKQVRDGLNVSQTVFARLLGVSDVLVRSWERGARVPAPIACRLLDQVRAYPAQFSKLVHYQARGRVLEHPAHKSQGKEAIPFEVSQPAPRRKMATAIGR